MNYSNFRWRILSLCCSDLGRGSECGGSGIHVLGCVSRLEHRSHHTILSISLQFSSQAGHGIVWSSNVPNIGLRCDVGLWTVKPLGVNTFYIPKQTQALESHSCLPLYVGHPSDLESQLPP